MNDEAEKLKAEANECFKKSDYEGAISLYDKAIEVAPEAPVLYSNRSIAHLRSESPGLALKDASKAIELDPKFLKAYYRRASAHMSMGKFKLALKDYESVSKVKPNDPDVKKKLAQCKKIVQQKAFEKAIAGDEKTEEPLPDFKDMKIDDSYTGPALLDSGKPDIAFMENLQSWYIDQKRLHKKYLFQMLVNGIEHYKAKPSLVELTIPDDGKLTVCGDTHGQYYDLNNIFKLNGKPSAENPYLFNGDFVDRGSWGLEVFITLLGWKLHDEKCMYLTRGNHETKSMNELYGFEGEVRHKVGGNSFRFFTTIFQSLPICYLINNKALVMHGGLPMVDGVVLDDIKKLSRECEPGEQGTLTDLLWADPQDNMGRGMSKRGTSMQFGPDVTERFCKQNNIDYIIRSHEVKEKGWERQHNGRCWTIFSAPNYCDQRGNDGAWLTLKPSNNLVPEPTEFKAVEHPPVPPMMYANPMLRGMM